MTHSKATPSFLALTCFGLAAAPALAQDTSSEAHGSRLGGVTVTDTAVDEEIKVDTLSSPKFTQPIQDIPQTQPAADHRADSADKQACDPDQW